MLAPLLTLVVLLDLTVSSASALSARYESTTIHESRSRVPHGWEKRTSLPSSSPFSKRGASPSLDKKAFTIPLRIHLAQRNVDSAHSMLMDVSDPASPNFGKHWSPERIVDTFAPSGESVDEVLKWLEDAGIELSRAVYSKPKGSVMIDMSLEEAEDLLHTKYDLYTHTPSSRPHIACTSYSLPSSIAHHIDFVTPTLHFDVPLKPAEPHQLPDHDPSFPSHRSPRSEKRGVEERDEELEKRAAKAGIAASVGDPALAGAYPVHLKTDGLINLGNKAAAVGDVSQCDVRITPVCLEALYGFSPSSVKGASKNTYGIVEYTPQSYIPTDLDVFFRNFTPSLVGTRPKLVSIDGGVVLTNISDFDIAGESNLDLTFGISLTYPTPVTLYQVGDPVGGASFNNFLDALDGSYCSYKGGDESDQDTPYPDPLPGGYKGKEDCGDKKRTNVISTSYAYNEADLTPFYEERQCYEYLKLGLLGTTILYSSGDYGVAGNSGQCIIPSTAPGPAQYGAAYGTGKNATVFNPSFPGTCPYITSVGATQVNPNATVYEREGACEQVIYSGGGFSNVFPLPTYQSLAVHTYFSKHKPSYSASQYNNTQRTRGFPDISANGANYAVPIGGKYYRVFGTSASSPVVGAIVTLLNGERLSVGKGPVGFINPVLYTNPWALNDIISGGNQGCGTPGFSAVPGWDPVTGLGTPNYPKLLEIYKFLP